MEREDFIQLFRKYRTKLCNFLFYKCGDMDYAEDLVQEVFANLWEKRDTIKSGNLKSYLYTAANNLYIDHFRHTNFRLELNHNTTSTTSESPEFLLEQKEFDLKLQNAIASLSEKEKIVFLLNRIDGLTHREIAEILEISVKSVEKRMHNAVEKLYKKINHKL